MTTPPIELAATVERVEWKEPPEPEAIIYWPYGKSFWCAHAYQTVEEARVAAESMSPKGVRLVRISPAPSPAETFSNEEKAALYKSGWDFGFAHAKSMLSPAETGAVPVDLIRRAAMALENVGKYGVASDLYAWLATQRGTR